MMTQNSTSTQISCAPQQTYHAYNSEYDPEWYNAYEASAYFELAKDEDGNHLPHCLMLSIKPGKVTDLFKVEQQSWWMITVCVFRNDYELSKFLENSRGRVVSALSSTGIELIE